MAIGDVVENLSIILPPEIAARVDGLIIVLKAVGVFAIIYVLYIIVMGFLGFRSRKRMRSIEKKVKSIDKKLDKLLKEKFKSKARNSVPSKK